MATTAAILLALALLAPATAGAQEQGDPGAGRKYAEAVCGRCHAVLPDGTASPLREAPAFKTIANTPGMTGTALSVWLQSSHPTMPNIVLTPDDLHDVIAYILSLKD